MTKRLVTAAQAFVPLREYATSAKANFEKIGRIEVTHNISVDPQLVLSLLDALDALEPPR